MIYKLPFLALNTKGSPQHCLKSIYPVCGSSIQSGLFEYCQIQEKSIQLSHTK